MEKPCKNCGENLEEDNIFECENCNAKYCKACAEKNKGICTLCYNQVKRIQIIFLKFYSLNLIESFLFL